MTEKKLTVAQEKFAQALASGQSKADAYREAYPKSRKWQAKSVHAKASTLAAKEMVAIRINELREVVRREVVRATAFDGLAWTQQALRLAFADVRQLVHKDGAKAGRTKAPHELDDDIAQAVVGARYRDGEWEYKLAAKPPIMDQLGRRLGLFGDDQHRNPVGALAEFLRALGAAGKIRAVEDIEASPVRAVDRPPGALMVNGGRDGGG